MKQGKQHNLRQNPVYLLFWPVFGLRYLLIEQFNPAKRYHPVSCFLDERIPFLEGFLIPYVLWYFCIIGVHLWLFIRNDPVYRLYSWYLIFTIAISTMVFLLFPTCQNLRMEEFPRDNRLTAAVNLLYRMDTNTNVCPSEHVIGSVGFFLAVAYSDRAARSGRIISGLLSVLTAGATVFLKQHSVVDVIAAVPVCVAGWYAAFYKGSKRRE